MELWTPEHTRTLLPSLAVMVVLTVVLRLTLGKKPLHIRMIPFQVIACLLVLIEIGKQITSLIEGYDLYFLPFHFCSLFIFMLPFMAFYRGKHMQKVGAVTASLSCAMFLLMLIYPNLIYSAANIKEYFQVYLSFHTVTFHNLVMLAFLLIPALELHTPATKKEPVYALIFTIGFCIVAASMAHILKTNYANFYTCNVPVLEQVRLSMQPILGKVGTQFLYVAINTTLHIVFVQLSYWFYRLLRSVICGKQKVAV